MFRSSFYVTSFFLDHWYYAESHEQSDSSSVLQYYSKDSSYLYLQTKGSPGQPDLLDNAHFFFLPYRHISSLFTTIPDLPLFYDLRTLINSFIQTGPFLVAQMLSTCTSTAQKTR